MQKRDDFWAAVYRIAARVKGLPTWTQAGIVLSDNFEGGVPVKRDRKADETRKSDDE